VTVRHDHGTTNNFVATQLVEDGIHLTQSQRVTLDVTRILPPSAKASSSISSTLLPPNVELMQAPCGSPCARWQGHAAKFQRRTAIKEF